MPKTNPLKKALMILFPILLVVILGVSAYFLIQDLMMKDQLGTLEQEFNQYKPVTAEQVSAMKLDFNNDLFAWLFLDDTNIEFPVVQGSDNDYYLNRDAKKAYSQAGSIFMDYRCEKDFSMFNSIIYGHNLRNGTMFSNLKDYGDKKFFDLHRTGQIITETATFRLDIFAYFLVDVNSPVYNLAFIEPDSKEEHLAYIRENASLYRDIGVTPDDHIVTISTCNRALGKNGRSIIIARLVEE